MPLIKEIDTGTPIRVAEASVTLTIDGQPVSSARQVIERVAAHPAGRPLGLTLRRDGRLLPLQLALPLLPGP